MASLEVIRGGKDDRTERGVAMESSREPFMAPLGLGSVGNIGGCEVAKGTSQFSLLLVQVDYSSRVTEMEMEREGDQSMSRNNPVSMEDSRDGCHCSRCGGWSVGGSSKEHAFNTPLMGGEENPGEA